MRGKPVAVSAYAGKNGCVLAASVEAKRFGVKTGMRVQDAKMLCQNIIVLPSDPAKYRYIHVMLRSILQDYTNDMFPKSIDEFVLNFKGSTYAQEDLFEVAKEIKRKIKREIGSHITVSVGISTNRYLAKTASNLQKPDGLSEINRKNFLQVYSKLQLMDLCGIAHNNLLRLNRWGIFNVLDLFNTKTHMLHSAFNSVVGYYWYLRLRGWEIEDYEPVRKSFSNSYSPPKVFSTLWEITPVLTKLVEKTSLRLRNGGYKARGIYLAVSYRNRSFWHMSKKTKEFLFNSRDIYKEITALFLKSPMNPIHTISVGVFSLVQSGNTQLYLFSDALKKESLTKAVDFLNNKWGNFVVSPASMLSKQKYVHDAVGFGRIRELDSGSLDALQTW